MTIEYINSLRNLAKGNFPFKSPRDGQIETVVNICKSFLSGKKYVVLEAGTGAGKSVIAYTVQKVLQSLEVSESAIFLTKTRALQSQYSNEFSDVKPVFGVSNYPCNEYPNEAEVWNNTIPNDIFTKTLVRLDKNLDLQRIIKMSNEHSIEAEIQAKGLNAPRLSPELIDDAIISEDYYVFPGTSTTVCCLTLKNGFTVIGESSCVSSQNFDAEVGKKVARSHARDKIWVLEGYLLQDRLFNLK